MNQIEGYGLHFLIRVGAAPRRAVEKDIKAWAC